MARNYHHFLLPNSPGVDMHHLSSICLDDGLCKISEKSLSLPFLNPNLPITASSCDGLLYLDDMSGFVYLCNLSTKQFQSIPVEPALAITGSGSLGYDAKSNDYKIVWFHHNGARVYSLKDDYWREIPMPSASPTGKIIVMGTHENISVDGGCYWLALAGKSMVVLCFNFSSECFSYFPLPTLPQVFIENLLVKLNDGWLGVVCYWRKFGKTLADRGYFYQLWVRKVDWDPEVEWEMVFEDCLCDGVGVPLGIVDTRIVDGCDGADGVILNGRYLFLLGMTVYGDDDPSRAFLYDLYTKEYREVLISRMVFSHSEDDGDIGFPRGGVVFSHRAGDVVLPRGNPIASGTIINNNSRPTHADPIMYIDGSEEEEEEEDVHNLDAYVTEESKMIDLFHMSMSEEYEEKMEAEAADPAKVEAKMKKLELEKARMKELELEWVSKLPKEEVEFMELLPKSYEEYRKRVESYADYAKTTDGALYLARKPKEYYDISWSPGGDNPDLRETRKFVEWFNKREQMKKEDDEVFF